MFVDIIMPVYNPGAYLIEALDSCMSQSYKDFKVTVIDDCSTENIKSVLKRYPKVDYLKTEKNLGPAGARNHGIKNTSGELISFLDSDDIMDKDKLSNSVAEFKKDGNIGMTCGNYRILVNRARLQRPFYKRAPTVNWNTLMRQNLVASGSVTVRRDVIEDIGLFDERYWIGEDYDCWLKISEKYQIKYIHKILYYYSWVTKDGSSLTKRGDIQKDHLKNLEAIRRDSKNRMKSVGDK